MSAPLPSCPTAPGPRPVRDRLLAVAVALLAAAGCCAALWPSLAPQPTAEKYTVVSATQAEQRYPCRGGTCVRDFTRLLVHTTEDGVSIQREVEAPPRLSPQPGQPVTLYHGTLGQLSYDREMPARVTNALILSSLAGAGAGGATTFVLSRRTRES